MVSETDEARTREPGEAICNMGLCDVFPGARDSLCWELTTGVGSHGANDPEPKVLPRSITAEKLKAASLLVEVLGNEAEAPLAEPTRRFQRRDEEDDAEPLTQPLASVGEDALRNTGSAT